MSTEMLNNEMSSDLKLALRAYTGKLDQWLLQSAFDTWWQAGADKSGGFHERVALTGEPVAEDHRRARVQPRQAYCYSVAGKLGWNGPWREAVRHGVEWFEQTYKRPDGLYGTLADSDGNLVDDEFDLYNHAFALLGLASAATAFPDSFEVYHSRALQILSLLRAGYQHPIGGFQSSNPPREPLCANPHMHMLEAALAWEVAAPQEPKWESLADEISNLAQSHMIDASSGALREFFDFQWRPMSGVQGRIVEPGHQFEWAWLLAIWSERRGRAEALERARRLFDIAEENGICPTREVAIMGLYDDFSVHSDLARLWSQTEWLKSAVRLASHSLGAQRQRYLQSALKAADALQNFINDAPAGLWYDKFLLDAGMLDEPAPASTFYHIVAARVELQSFSRNDL